MGNALFITLVGMLAVYAFLLILMWCVQMMSVCVTKTSAQSKEKIAALIGIALQREKK